MLEVNWEPVGGQGEKEIQEGYDLLFGKESDNSL